MNTSKIRKNFDQTTIFLPDFYNSKTKSSQFGYKVIFLTNIT